jgi:hypothetical protein
MFQGTPLPAAPNPIDAWNTFLLCMVALSVATERVTEMIKQWIGPTLSRWLTPPRYMAAIQLVAIISGIFVTALSGRNPIDVPNFQPFAWGNPRNWLGWIVTGVLVSGGSAFWNHLLDILQAAKVAKEQALQPPPAGSAQ